PDESYLQMGLGALEGWREIERASGERLLWATGALSHGRFAERQLPALEAAGVAAELISGDEALTQFRVRVAGDGPLLHQPDAGVIHADRARAALLRMAAAAGAELREGARVRSVAERGESVEIETDSGRRRCAAAIVAAGPWSGELLAATGIEAPLSVSSQTVAYFSLE